MSDMEHKALLYAKLSSIASDLAGVPQSGKHQQGYKYSTLGDILGRVKPLLAHHSVAIVPSTAEHSLFDVVTSNGKPGMGCHVTIAYEICDSETGYSIIATWQAQADSYGDTKALAKAQTTCLRTFLLHLFQIPAEDEQEARKPVQQRTQPAPRPAPKQPTLSVEKAAAIEKLYALFEQERHLGQPSKDERMNLAGLDIGDLGKMIAEHSKMVDTLSQTKLAERYGEIIGLKPGENLMVAVRRYTGTGAATPTTYEGWRQMAEEIKAVKHTKDKYAPTADQQADIDAMDKELSKI